MLVMLDDCRLNLHSNMYLLILSVRDIVAVGAPHLHSNMYLLIPVIAVREALYRVNLHSNMYLLIPLRTAILKCALAIYIPTCIY